MLHVRKLSNLSDLTAHLADSGQADAAVFNEAIATLGQTNKTKRIEQLIQSGAWTDAALALIDLELPLWQVRRIARDDGVWYCALSRQRELPDWLDQSVEANHADLALAILSALVEARRLGAPEYRTSVPDARDTTRDLYERLPIDNYV